MTTKKHSLLDRKVLRKDLNDPLELLSPKNINKEKLYEYIRDACDYCTDYQVRLQSLLRNKLHQHHCLFFQLPHLEFALNHHGDPDVALFDFTSMFAAGYASHIMEKNQKQLLFGLVGDGLLEVFRLRCLVKTYIIIFQPFWPTGTGIARGFLGGLDAVWMVRQWASGDMTPIEVMEEREAILKLLPQTTPENLTKNFSSITMEPKTRYPSIPIQLIRSQEVRHQYKSDTPDNADVPRYRHPSFKEVQTKYALRRNKQPTMNLDAFKIANDPAKERKIDNGQSEASAADFYQAMRDKRRNEINAEKDIGKMNNSSPQGRRSSVTNNRPVNSSEPPPAQTMTLKERIEARRAAMERDAGGEKSEKNISVSDIASKAEFVRKMSKTFGYGMPSNAEEKPDTITSEAEKCALLVKSASSKKSNINKPKRRKSGEAGDKEKKKERKSKNGGVGSRDRQCDAPPKIETWDFSKNKKPGSVAGSGLHSSVAPIVPELDIEIDPELDCLLAQLEHDDSFSKLGDNEQKAWLESLFFQDTTHLPGRVNNPRDQLKPGKSKPKNQLRVNRNAGEKNDVDRVPDDPPPDPETVTSVHVNDKMKNLAADFFKADKQTNRNSLPARTMTESLPKTNRKMSDSSFETSKAGLTSSSNRMLRNSVNSREDSPASVIPSPALSRKSSGASFATPPTSRKSSEIREPQRPSSIEESCNRISGVNDSLSSLAQSYFSAPQKPVSRKPSIKEESNTTKDDDQKASLVASFFGPGGGKPAASSNKPSALKQSPAVSKVPERASYEPEGQEVSDEDDDDIEKLIRAAEAELRAKNEAPEPPTR